MSLTRDLMGVGMSPALATRVGYAPAANPVVGVGTTQAGGKVLTTDATIGVPVTNQTAYLLPAVASGKELMKELFFFNAAATAVTALIYPPADGSTLNGSTSAAISVAQNKACIFIPVVGAAGGITWFAINSA